MLNDSYLVELVKKTAEFGNGKIHIIVNNAGFTWDGVLHKVDSNPPKFSFVSLTNNQDHRQAMGHHPRPPLRGSLQAHPCRRTLLPRQRRRTKKYNQHLLNQWSSRQCRPSQLRSRQSRCRRPHKDNRERMGSSIWCSRKHSCFRIHSDSADSG